MKKNLFLILATVLITVSGVFAQAPETMSYQAVVRNASNELATNHPIGMQISILDGTETAVFVERHYPTTNANGLVTIEIGTGTVIEGNFTGIEWKNDTYFVKTEIDLNGGANYTIEGISQLLSVPYALHAKTAETLSGDEQDPVFTAWDKDYEDLTNKPDLSVFIETETDPVFNSSVAAEIEASDILNWNNKLDNIEGSTEGDMLYWSGEEWIEVSAGDDYQVLTFCNGVPTWTSNGACPHLAIGDNFGGGVVAYIFQSGDPDYVQGEVHGIIAAPNDQSSGIPWGCHGTGITGTSDNLGTGPSNTLAIVIGCDDNNTAAKLCSNLVLNGYSDWFLPSRDELQKLFQNKEVIGGFQNVSYWSSTQSSTTFAKVVNFETGDNLTSSKSIDVRVRAIRYF